MKKLSFDKQKNRFREFLKERKYHLSLFGRNPGDDWKLLLLTFIFFLGIISASGILTYINLLEITEGDDPVIRSADKIIEVEEVDVVIDRFVNTE